ncbi:MAG: DUF4112 domain-containing protein [Pseudomonadota bacterium]
MTKRNEPAELRSVDRLAWLLDSSLPLPFGRSVGLDGLLGLVPGAGDLLGTALSGYIVARAWRLGVPRPVLLRMLANIGLETVVGIVPVIGDLFDLAFKANQRNVSLLRENLTDPRSTERRSRLLLALGIALIGLMLLLCAAATVWVLAWMWRQLV